MKVTVAMCTYNPSRDTIRRALDAIVSQLGDVPSTEVIVIDNNSSPSLAESQYLSGYPVHLIREPKPGLTAAREAAINNARGDVIVFVDDDNILGENYLRTVANAFSADARLGLLGGNISPEYETPPPSWFEEFEPWLAVRRYPPELRIETAELPITPPYTKDFPVGAGFAVRRDLATAHQEDCTSSTRIEGRRGQALSSGEDRDLGFFILSRGDKLVVAGSLSLIHVIGAGRFRVEYLERLAAGNVKSAWALEKKWSQRFGCRLYPMLSLSYVNIFARVIASAMLGLCSPRYRIKRRVYTTLIRTRLHGNSV